MNRAIFSLTCRKVFVSKPEKGVGYITLFVFGLLFVAAFYSASKILPFYYYYYDLQNQMESLIRVASDNTDQQIRKKLMYFIKKYDIPARDQDLQISRGSNMMKIQLRYKEVFYATWQGKDYDIHTFEFLAQAEGKF